MDGDISPLSAQGTGGVVFGFSLLSLPLFSLRRVTREDGQLRTLGCGSTMISAKAAKSLGLWQIVALVGCSGALYVGLWTAIPIGLLGVEGSTTYTQIQPGKTSKFKPCWLASSSPTSCPAPFLRGTFR